MAKELIEGTRLRYCYIWIHLRRILSILNRSRRRIGRVCSVHSWRPDSMC